MTLNFILDIVIILSLGAILYIVARTLPRINDEATATELTVRTHPLIFYFEKFDERLRFFIEKLLHRVRLILLKLDNFVSQRLASFKKSKEKESVFPLQNDKQEEEK